MADTKQVGLNLAESVSTAGVISPLVVRSDTRVADVLQLLRAEDRSSVLVCREDGRLLGIFTERDALKQMAAALALSQRSTASETVSTAGETGSSACETGPGDAASGDPLEAAVETAMTPDPFTLVMNDTISAAVRQMSSKGYRRLPIVDRERKPVGLVSTAAIVHWLVEHFPESVYNLPPVSDPAPQEREGP